MKNTFESVQSNWSLNKAINEKFLFIEFLSEYKKTKKLDKIELCIIKTDFSKPDLKIISKLIQLNKFVEFWITTENFNRKNIVLANKIGIKNIIPFDFDKNLINNFFNKKDINFLKDKITSETTYPSLNGLKVMIVDDNLMNVELLEEILSKLDLKISCHVKPNLAYEEILHEKFDLFLLDIMMPEISGFDLAKKIKETPHNKHTPIVFISALSDSENKIAGYDLGSCAYIEKPFDVNIIRSQIYNILKNQKIQEIISLKNDSFFATVAHDLKTPINAEINALNLILNNKENLDDFQQEILEDILNSTKFMQDMVQNILLKSTIEHGKMNLSKQICSLEELARHCIDLTKYILAEKKQRIIFKCRTNNALLPIDFMEIKRVIHNLIANASKYSPEGGKIIIEIFNCDTNIALSVQDFGVGIALKDQQDIFLQYMTLAKKHKTVGSGLGLYISKRIVEAHDGEILLESKQGWGTKITMILPQYTKV